MPPRVVKPKPTAAVKPTPTPRSSPNTKRPTMTSSARTINSSVRHVVRSAPTSKTASSPASRPSSQAPKASPSASKPSPSPSKASPSASKASPPVSRVSSSKSRSTEKPPAPLPEPSCSDSSASFDLGPPPISSQLFRRSVSSVTSITTDAEEVRRLRTQLQSMKEQVHFLHTMMQGLTKPEQQQVTNDERKRLSFSGISPVKKTRGSVEVLVMPESQNPFQEPWSPPGNSDRDLASRVDELQRQNDSLKTQLQEKTTALETAKTTYEAQLEEYVAKLAVIDAENMQLHAHVEEYEEENLRLHAALAEMTNEQDLTNISNNQGEGPSGDLEDELGIDGLGEEREDIHERCDAKIHELWQTIKTLKAYVETFRVENEDLRIQRDNAMASAERAWQDNSKLAGNNNPQQKIKYVEGLKQENAELIEKVRELQSKLTKKQFKRGNSKRKDDRGSSASESEPLEEYPSMESADNHSDDGSYEERTKLLKKMWARNKKLEEEIDRLQKEKQALVMRQSRSPSVDSRQSSATRSTARSTVQSTTSSRWKK